MKSKIHRVRVTESNLNYVGSITIDEDLMDAAGLIEGEKVQIVNNNNGERIETYVIKGEPRIPTNTKPQTRTIIKTVATAARATFASVNRVIQAL